MHFVCMHHLLLGQYNISQWLGMWQICQCCSKGTTKGTGYCYIIGMLCPKPFIKVNAVLLCFGFRVSSFWMASSSSHVTACPIYNPLAVPNLLDSWGQLHLFLWQICDSLLLSAVVYATLSWLVLSHCEVLVVVVYTWLTWWGPFYTLTAITGA